LEAEIGQKGRSFQRRRTASPLKANDPTLATPINGSEGCQFRTFQPLCTRASRMSVTGGAYPSELTAVPETE